MAKKTWLFNLFSNRESARRGELPDVYTYGELPPNLRVQCVQVMQECCQRLMLEDDHLHRCIKILRKNLGVFLLGPRGADHTDCYGRHDPEKEYYNSFLHEGNVERALDYLEVFFGVLSERYTHHIVPFEEEINTCFRQAGVGFQLEDYKIIRIDSQLVHTEVVKPALAFLSAKYLKGAQEEFLKAHEFYRQGKTKEAILNCGNAFESTMKAIAKKRGWTHDKGATARPLVELMRDKQLVPGYWVQNLSHLTGMLTASVPTGRNNNGGHGQGPDPVDVPLTVASYVLHMTASAILFLAQAEKELR